MGDAEGRPDNWPARQWDEHVAPFADRRDALQSDVDALQDVFATLVHMQVKAREGDTCDLPYPLNTFGTAPCDGDGPDG